MRYSGFFGVRSVGPLGDFLEFWDHVCFGCRVLVRGQGKGTQSSSSSQELCLDVPLNLVTSLRIWGLFFLIPFLLFNFSICKLVWHTPNPSLICKHMQSLHSRSPTPPWFLQERSLWKDSFLLWTSPRRHCASLWKVRGSDQGWQGEQGQLGEQGQDSENSRHRQFWWWPFQDGENVTLFNGEESWPTQRLGKWSLVTAGSSPGGFCLKKIL